MSAAREHGLEVLPENTFAFLIANYDYKEIRQLAGFEDFHDVLNAPIDTTTVFKKMIDIGVPMVNRHQAHNVRAKELCEIYKIAANLAKVRGKLGKETFVLFAFSGHAMIDDLGRSLAICSKLEWNED